MSITLAIKFHTSEEAVSWFLDAQRRGALPEAAGIRRADALDHKSRRVERGELIISGDAEAVSPWLVESARARETRKAREASHADDLAALIRTTRPIGRVAPAA